jgi:hypothetical protein
LVHGICNPDFRAVIEPPHNRFKSPRVWVIRDRVGRCFSRKTGKGRVTVPQGRQENYRENRKEDNAPFV